MKIEIEKLEKESEEEKKVGKTPPRLLFMEFAQGKKEAQKDKEVQTP